ncbi:acetyl-CoA C-acyltransferase [Flavobacteriales bacterium]|nr:acetyl-CoA C-acyltransferase [Flavobacteriales bacterium]
MNTAYIIAGYRSAVGKSGQGVFKFTRPDDLAADVVKHLVKSVPHLDTEKIDDVIVGNATPEAEQGLNIGRMISLMGLDTIKVPGMTVNRYCSSGLETIAIANSKIQNGMADCIIAGGVETMSPIPFGGWRIIPNYEVSKDNPDWYWNMGLTAEAVAEKWNISREEQDEYALNSHKKALNAIEKGYFKNGIVPITIKKTYLDKNEKRKEREYVVDTDEGPRKGGTIEALNKLRPVFAQNGSVTAGNASQTSDGAAFVLLMSEKIVNELDLKPIAKLLSYQVAGVEPKHMGIGPIEAVPMALEKAGLELDSIEQIELNEAFASQSLAVIRELGLNPEIVNVNGGAIALGHPLGCTGGKLTVQLINEMKRRNQKYGMVTMCVGAGQGAAGIFEIL